MALGKLTLTLPLEEFVRSQVQLYGFIPLLIEYEHTYEVRMLPQHHRDPFDRLLIAQAKVENLLFLTHDSNIPAYDIPILW